MKLIDKLLSTVTRHDKYGNKVRSQKNGEVFHKIQPPLVKVTKTPKYKHKIPKFGG